MRAYTALMLGLSGAWLTAFSPAAHAQFKLQETFEGTSAPGWTLSSSALLTAPSIDAAGAGWLRLTAAVLNQKGLALNGAFAFPSNLPVVVQFNYVSWGGTGADGMTLFLYDSTAVTPMAGALTGGGLGYCGGAGGYLAIGLDEYGNFSNPHDKCTLASGGPGRTPESLVIRGPESATNPWVSTTAVPGNIDNPHAASRPSPKTVLFSLTPAVAPAVGYTITAQFQSAAGQPFQTLFSNVAFPYSPPANLSVGFSGSTGGSTNIHELHGLATATADDLQVQVTGPASILQGASVSYLVTLTNNGSYAIGSSDAPTLLDAVPAAITGTTWTCAGSGGATCDASGTGSINTSNITLPANGSVVYTITGTLDPATACASTVSNSAAAQFGSTSSFLDPDQTNNSATVNSTVTCQATLTANPTSLSYSPQQLNVTSAPQTVTLTEGSNGTATITGISLTGDYAQTNNCPATLGAAQTCTINVTFMPTAAGSRNGTLTIQSNLSGAATVSAVVNLTGTGINSIPSPFSFTPLADVDPSSVQVSNPITVASTTVPAPISVSGGMYSINGGPFTSVPGVVSPGAQVQVEVTAAAAYSTSVAATLTIGGVASTFSVTTGAQPVLQGGFTSVTGAVPNSVQTSNAITVTGTTIPAPINVSSGAMYSINGAPFTAAPGTAQPGDQVRLQMPAPPTYSTTSSSVVTIGGVSATFSVTTASQPVPQAGFTNVTGASVSSTQISNAITITSISAPSPISVSSGSLYSINGGTFTASPGVVQPGDQVRVETTASSAYATAVTSLLTIGGNDSIFTVTTGAKPVLQGTFAPISGAANSSTQTSNAITVTGISSPAAISVTSGAEYSINGGPFTAAPGTVKSGDELSVRLTAPASYATTVTATLTINGISTQFAVTTGPQPLEKVAVTGGGGLFDGLTLLFLGLIVVCRLPRRAGRWASCLVVLSAALISPSRAEELPTVAPWYLNLYGGLSIGDSTSSMTATKLANDLRADGYHISAAGAERGTATGSLYLGYELPNHWAAEISALYVGRTRAALEGVLPADLGPLLADTAHIVRGSGDVAALQARYRWPLSLALDLDLRAGPYIWQTTSDIYVSGIDALHRSDRGWGYTVGVGPRFSLGRHVALCVGAAYLNSTVQTQFWLLSATLEYHL